MLARDNADMSDLLSSDGRQKRLFRPIISLTAILVRDDASAFARARGEKSSSPPHPSLRNNVLGVPITHAVCRLCTRGWVAGGVAWLPFRLCDALLAVAPNVSSLRSTYTGPLVALCSACPVDVSRVEFRNEQLWLVFSSWARSFWAFLLIADSKGTLILQSHVPGTNSRQLFH